MPSDKLRRDFAPEQDVIDYLDSVPLMNRSYVINEAIRDYRDKQRNRKNLQLKIMATLERIESKLDEKS